VPQHAYKFDAIVGSDGKLELTVPLPDGVRVEVLVIAPQSESCSDLVEAANSSIGFWDNPIDDAEWNNA
jgi:hypothetical protein